MDYKAKIDLLKLNRTAVRTIKDTPCLIIPITYNDIYLSTDDIGMPKAAYLSLNISERREISQYGDTHNIKQSLTHNFQDMHPEDAEKIKGTYIGNCKPFDNQQQIQQATKAPALDDPDPSLESDLPF